MMSWQSLRRLVMIAAIVMTLPAVPSAQERRQAGPAPYDRSQEVTVKGKAGRSYTVPGGNELTILAIEVDGKPLQLILAPADFIKKQKADLAAAATVEATGLPGGHVNGEPAMLVRTLKIGTRTVALRDESGKPLWQ